MIDWIGAPVALERGAGAKWPGLQFIEEEPYPILPAATLNARDLTQILVHYRVPSLGRSIIELAMTVGPLVLLWAVMWATLHIGYWLCLLLAVPTAGFLVRLFMIQHDWRHVGFFHPDC